MSDSRIHEADETEVQEPRKRGLFRRGEDGLTTLEWLLIVAAVAGLAALAVVLVQNVVDQTAEQIGGSSARTTAAKVAAIEITRDAHDDVPDTEDEWIALMGDYEDACNRLEITYGDVEDLSVSWKGAVVPSPFTTSMQITNWQAALDGDDEGCVIES